MNPITRKITVRGQQIKTRTPRAFAVVAVRPEPIPAADGGVYVPFATVLRRTDSIETARTAARRSSWHTGRGVAVVVVDLATGQESLDGRHARSNSSADASSSRSTWHSAPQESSLVRQGQTPRRPGQPGRTRGCSAQTQDRRTP